MDYSIRISKAELKKQGGFNNKHNFQFSLVGEVQPEYYSIKKPTAAGLAVYITYYFL
jgi:hypothetical protein